MKKVTILVATHKPFPMPRDELYLPIHAGSALNPPKNPTATKSTKPHITRDDTGANISKKNPYYSELTALYWGWKHLKDAEYIGLVHYRRHLSTKPVKFGRVETRLAKILTLAEADAILGDDCSILLPKKRHYYIETLYSHYRHTLYPEPLDAAGKIVREKYPDFYPAFERLKRRRSMHAFNIFVMRRDILDEYCTWLFDILGELERCVDQDQYDDFHRRFYGRISELLLDVFLETRGYHTQARELHVVEMQHVNWPKKASLFLQAKFSGKKYDHSL